MMWEKRLRDSRGAALIEFALVAPMFIFLTFAALQYAYIIFIWSTMEYSMYSATRVAKVSDDSAATVAAIRQTMQDQSLGLLDANEILITTDLNVNLASNWQNAPAEQCAPPDTGTCPCAGGSWVDSNGDNECDIGPPPIVLQAPGNLVNFRAFYKITPFLPAFDMLVNTPDGEMALTAATTIRVEPAL